MLPRMRRWVLLAVLAVVHFAVLVWMVGKVKTAVNETRSKSTLALTSDHAPNKINETNVKKYLNNERSFPNDKLLYDEGNRDATSSATRHIVVKKVKIDAQISKNASTQISAVAVSGVGKAQSTLRHNQDGDGGLLRNGGDGKKNLESEDSQKQNGKSTESPDVCGYFQKPAMQAMDEVFQPIAGSHSFVFSAFAISDDAVRAVLVYDKSDDANAFSCNYRQDRIDVTTVTDSNSESFSVLDKVQGTLKRIRDDHGLPYTAAFLNCRIPHNVSTLRNLSLSITYGGCRKPPTNLLPVQILPSQISWEFTVCVAPFHSNYDKTDTLVEMIELNRILGAEHFYFYNESCSLGIAKVLADYQNEGLVNVIQWHLPHEHPSRSNLDRNRKEEQLYIHYKGQNAAINDCLYRNRKRSKYVVIQDLDEFIIPQNPNITTWSQLVKSRLALDEKKVNFLVRSSFYRKEWIHPQNKFPLLDRAKKFNSIVLQNIQREENIFQHKIRSKYIADPSLVDEGGIHYVYRPSNRLTDEVPTSEAIVHHYRLQWNPDKPALRVFDDIVIRRYGEQLVTAVEHARRRIGLT